MSCKNKVITSEYVSFGHPDKLADQIADAILDELLKQDKNTRSGIEVLVKDNVVVLGGEVRTTAIVNYDAVVKRVFEDVHYPASHGLKPEQIKVINLIGKQSIEIHQGVDKSETNIGAGDQGFCVGYASNETNCYMPLGHYLAKTICKYVSVQNDLGPDTKTQVVIGYDEDETPCVQSILVSTMHSPLSSLNRVRRIVKGAVLSNYCNMDVDVYEKYIKDKDIKIDINPCGEWTIGGPVSDCGVTGRKIVVDQFGGYANVGGGAFSGNDFTKVDRSAAHMARYLAKNIVAAGIADNAKVELAYMIGVAKPCALNIELNRNQERVCELKEWILNNVDTTPYGIIKRFDGFYPRNYFLARNGHYGQTDESLLWEVNKKYYPWEITDLADKLANIFA